MLQSFKKESIILKSFRVSHLKMHEKPSLYNSPIIIGALTILFLSGCSGMMSNKLSSADQLKMDTMDTTIAEHTQQIETLEGSVEHLKDQNIQLGREVLHLKEVVDGFKEDVEVAKQAAVNAERRAMRGGGDVAIHLASYRNMETTVAGWQSYTDKYGDDFSSLVGIVSIFTSGSGESFYRLKAGPFISQAEALEFCKVLEAKGDYCNVDKFEGDILD